MTQAPSAPVASSFNPVNIARAILAASSPEQLILAIAGTDYQLHLVPTAPVTGEVGKRTRGVVRAQARRIDVTQTGGRFVEPVYGRPRRIQGTIVAVDPGADTVTVMVHDGLPIVCKTNGQQRAAEFKEGQFVGFDVAPGSTFTQSA